MSGNGATFGGGVHGSGLSPARILIRNSTIAGNSASNQGGGIDMVGGRVRLDSTILAGNTAPDGPECSVPFEPMMSRGYNLIEDPSGCDVVGRTDLDLTGVDPLLGPLQDNGGPTETRALPPRQPCARGRRVAAVVPRSRPARRTSHRPLRHRRLRGAVEAKASGLPYAARLDGALRSSRTSLGARRALAPAAVLFDCAAALADCRRAGRGGGPTRVGATERVPSSPRSAPQRHGRQRSQPFRNARRSALTSSFRVVHMPCGPPG